MQYDAILVVSFGGPEKRADVIPFLQNVLRGKNVPRERMLEVAEHYYRLGGKSPINDRTRSLIAALEACLREEGPCLPIYWGNRNWHPMLADTLRQMRADRVRQALAFVTSAYSSYSGCRQYLEDIGRAQAEVGRGAPAVDKLRVFYNHPGFVQAVTERVQEALAQISEEQRRATTIVYTAHSIPLSMAQNCEYVQQLQETCRLVSEGLGRAGDPLVYQSRSGPPTQPWLGPDILDYLREFKGRIEGNSLVVEPIGFICDHLEVVYDLDIEARALCEQLGIRMVRAATVGTHPKFIHMIRELVLERLQGGEQRTLGVHGPHADDCPANCCARPSTTGRA